MEHGRSGGTEVATETTRSAVMQLTNRDREAIADAASNADDADLVWKVADAVAGALADECRQQQPWVPMRAVFDGNGLRYCCVHEPTRHCTGRLDGTV
jgi:hypothetical protein